MQITIDIDDKLFDTLTRMAESYRMDVEQWLEYHLEEEYGR
jgi:hypothetical protein